VSIVPDVAHHAEVLAGHDHIDGGEGDDLLVGDFGVLAIPVVSTTPITDDDARMLESHTERLRNDLENYFTQRRHELDYDELHDRYTHPHYGHRGGTQQEVTIRAGNDALSGAAGGDIILRDSASLVITYMAEPPHLPAAPSDMAFNLKYMSRGDFELTNHYQRNGDASQVSGDVIAGGPGDDLLFGQRENDEVFGGEDNDLVYGSDGGSDLVDGGDGINDVRARGDDWPKGDSLVRAKQLAGPAVVAASRAQLRAANVQPPALVPYNATFDYGDAHAGVGRQLAISGSPHVSNECESAHWNDHRQLPAGRSSGQEQRCRGVR